MAKGYFVKNGVNYVVWEGLARIGDLVLFVDNCYDVSYGNVYKVIETDGTYVEIVDDEGDLNVWDYDGSFIVLRKSDDQTSEPPQDILDMLTNLSRKYNELDERLDSVETDVGTISIDGEEVAHKLGEIGGILNG